MTSINTNEGPVTSINTNEGPVPGALSTPKQVFAEGYEFSYLDIGQGEPLVLVHGSLLDYRYWLQIIPALAQSYRVIVISRRYHWPNAKPLGEFSYTSGEHTDDLIAILDALNLGPVHLLGHSYAGYLAARLISSRPALVRSLILAAPGGQFEGEAPGRSRVADHNKAAALISAGNVAEGVAHFMDTICFDPCWKDCPKDYRQMTLDNAITVTEQIKEIRPTITEADLRNCICPTLLLGGANTTTPFPDTLDRIEELIPRAQRR